MVESSIRVVLRERASLQPNDPAFTFFDYDHDPDGVAETLSWAQLYRRSVNLSLELRGCAATGDRAVILAPQGLDYIVAFLAALEAGVIAVPLSVPTAAVHDERVSAVLGDAEPSMLLTTSGVASTVLPYARASAGERAPTVLEIDALDLDSRRAGGGHVADLPDIAYLQYTSGSTRTPAGVVVSHTNLSANWAQLIGGILPDFRMPRSTVSWLPFYHDMGLMLGVCAGILGGWPTTILSPMSFLQRPARWMQLLAGNPQVLSAAPNFAFELAAARTTDEDMAGLDLGEVLYILSGAERVSATTIRRFAQRFAAFNFAEAAIRPAYGLAEATLYVATHGPGGPPDFVNFDTEKLSDGQAQRCEPSGSNSTALVSYGTPLAPLVRIVDPDTETETIDGTVGEIWVHGDNVAAGYWRRPVETERIFAGRITRPSPGTPEGPWLRTGDLGFVSGGELFIVGRIKDLLIVRGRNHYPDDLEATISEISGGRAAAITVLDDPTEKLVVIVEYRKRGQSEDEVTENLRRVEERITAAISNAHGLSIQDVVLAAPGSIPITTSGKIRRASCVQLYRSGSFLRLNA